MDGHAPEPGKIFGLVPRGEASLESEGLVVGRKLYVWPSVLGASHAPSTRLKDAGKVDVLLATRSRPRSGVAAMCGSAATAGEVLGVITGTKLAHVHLRTVEEARRFVDAVRSRSCHNPALASGDSITVLVNPRSGGGKGVSIFEKTVRPLLAAAGLTYELTVTTAGSQIADKGREFAQRLALLLASTSSTPGPAAPLRPQSVILVGGDGTAAQFVNGILQGCLPNNNPRQLGERLAAVFSTLRLCVVASGTQNALARGLRAPTPLHAMCCFVKDKLRPLDALFVASGRNEFRLGFCGFAWGLPGAIAAGSESYRWLGRARYAALKVRHAVPTGLGFRKYRGKVFWSEADVSGKAAAAGGMKVKTISDGVGDGALLAMEEGAGAGIDGAVSPADSPPRGEEDLLKRRPLTLAPKTESAPVERKSGRRVNGAVLQDLEACGPHCLSCKPLSPAPPSDILSVPSSVSISSASSSASSSTSASAAIFSPAPLARAIPDAVSSPVKLAMLITGVEAARGATGGGGGVSLSLPSEGDGTTSGDGSSAESLSASSLTGPLSSSRKESDYYDEEAVNTKPSSGRLPVGGSGAGALGLIPSPVASSSSAVNLHGLGSPLLQTPQTPESASPGELRLYDHHHHQQPHGAAAGAGAAVASAAEEGEFIAVGVVNTSPDARFSHASDGCCDVVVAKKGGPLDSLGLMLRYVGRTVLGNRFTDERYSPLFTYVKTDTATVVPAPGQEHYPSNLDGETFAPGPFTVTVLPGLLTVYGGGDDV